MPNVIKNSIAAKCIRKVSADALKLSVMLACARDIYDEREGATTLVHSHVSLGDFLGAHRTAKSTSLLTERITLQEKRASAILCKLSHGALAA